MPAFVAAPWVKRQKFLKNHICFSERADGAAGAEFRLGKERGAG